MGCQQSVKKNTVVVTDTTSEPVGVETIAEPKQFSEESLKGVWTRTDAPYQIKVNAFLKDGNMEVGYFNPKSIHIGKSVWKKEANILQIYIELQDENYPGSYYQLTYFPDKQVLAGKYYQAVERVTYDVVFTKN